MIYMLNMNSSNRRIEYLHLLIPYFKYVCHIEFKKKKRISICFQAMYLKDELEESYRSPSNWETQSVNEKQYFHEMLEENKDILPFRINY